MKFNKPWLIILLFEIGYLAIGIVSQCKFFFNDGKIPPQNINVVFCLYIIFILLIIVYRKLLLYSIYNLNNRWLIIGCVIFNLTLLAIWPLTSTDIFTYIMHGRIISIYHADPYLQFINQFSFDPIIRHVCIQWQRIPMVYGPLWGIIIGALAWIGQHSLVLSLTIFRLFIIVVSGLCAWLLYKIMEVIAPAQKWLGVFLFLWNPLLLLETANGGHNDIIMIFLALAAFYLLLKKKQWFVLPVIFLAVLIKFVFLILLPFFVIFMLKEISGWKKRIQFISGNILIIVFIILVHLLIFPDIKSWVAGLRLQTSLFWEFYLSPLPALLLWCKEIFHISNQIIKNICILIYLIFYCYIIYKFVAKGKPDLLKLDKAIIFAIGGYLAFASFAFSEWYLLWLIPWLIIANTKEYHYWLIILSLAGLLTSSFFPFCFVLFVIMGSVQLIKAYRHVLFPKLYKK